MEPSLKDVRPDRSNAEAFRVAEPVAWLTLKYLPTRKLPDWSVET